MLPDGRFRVPPPDNLTLSTKLMIGGAIVAVMAAAVAIAVMAIWLLTMLIPVVIVAALIAYVIYRVKQWRLRGNLQRRNGPLTPR